MAHDSVVEQRARFRRSAGQHLSASDEFAKLFGIAKTVLQRKHGRIGGKPEALRSIGLAQNNREVLLLGNRIADLQFAVVNAVVLMNRDAPLAKEFRAIVTVIDQSDGVVGSLQSLREETSERAGS